MTEPETIPKFYDEEQLSVYSDRSEVELWKMARDGKIFRLVNTEGEALYPTCQFGNSGEVISHFMDTVRIFRQANIDDWTTLVQLTTMIGSTSMVDRLKLGQYQEVLVDAKKQVDFWNQ